MFKKIKKLNVNYKATVWTLIVTITLFVLLSPCFFFSLIDIPLGLLLGGIIGSIFLFLFGLSEEKDSKMKKPIFAIIVSFSRLIILLGLLFLLGYLQFGKHIKIFNVFLCAGGYIISIIILAIVSLKDKDCKNENSRERQSNKPD